MPITDPFGELQRLLDDARTFNQERLPAFTALNLQRLSRDAATQAEHIADRVLNQHDPNGVETFAEKVDRLKLHVPENVIANIGEVS